MTFTEAMDDVAKAFEALGAAVLVLGLLLSLAMSGRVWRRTRQGRVAYRTLRETFGGVLLLGLEILVAADLVRTVAVEPTDTAAATSATPAPRRGQTSIPSAGTRVSQNSSKSLSRSGCGPLLTKTS